MSLSPIPRLGLTTAAPLSFSQERLWFVEQLFPGTGNYNVPLILELDGPLDADAFHRALREVVARHEALRTVFPAHRGVPLQEVQPVTAFTIATSDISGASAHTRADRLEQRITEELDRPFALASDLPFRAHLIRESDTRHVLAGSLHHIVSDGWSREIMIRELVALYASFARGETPSLAPPAVSFIDFAAWQRQQLTGERTSRALDYWREHLADAPHLGLPIDRPRGSGGSMRTGSGGTIHEPVSEHVLAALGAFGRTQGATPFMTLLGAYVALLHLWTGQDDIVVGTPITNRSSRELENVVGFFLNMMPLRVDVSGRPTFRDLLARVQQVARSAYTHQHLPFEKLVEHLRPPRDHHRTPLFDAAFVFDNNPGALRDVTEAGDLKITRRLKRSNAARFDLLLDLPQDAGERMIRVIYRPALFDESTARGLAAWYHRLLSAIPHAPDARLTDLLPPTEAERATLAVLQAGSTSTAPLDRALNRLVGDQAAVSPNAPAVVDGAVSLTYAQLVARASALADQLRGAGVSPGDCVGMFLPRSADAIVAMLAILEAGAAYVPFDPGHPLERLAGMVRRAGVRVMVTNETLAGRCELPVTLVVQAFTEFAFPIASRADEADPQAMAYVLFTSGTTGEPKAVAIPHRAVVRLAYGMPDVPVERGTRVLHAAPLAFDASTFEVWVPLLHGGCVVVSPYELPTPAQLARVLTDNAVAVAWLTSSLFNLIVEEDVTALRSLRYLLTGGEALSPTHVERALEALPETVLINGYGPTETTTFATYHVISRDAPRRPSVPIGRPLQNTRVYVLDDERRALAPGLPGELWIGGEGVGLGYIGDAALTEQRFVPDPFSETPARMYRSGDRARFLADGTLEFIGRADDQLKVRGFRIEPAEIERSLGAHPHIERAVVTAQRLDGLGTVLAAHIVATRGTQALSSDELRAFLRNTLPEYMIPQLFDWVDTLPLGPQGKVDRTRLRAPLTPSPLPVDGAASILSETERQVAEVWQPLLGADGLSRTSHFFDLGGDSLRAARATARLAEACGVNLPVHVLFEFPTIGGLARVIDDQRQHSGKAASPLPATQATTADSPTFPVLAAPPSAIERGDRPLTLAEVMTTISEAWRAVLSIDRPELDDNFFALGGHSLMAIRLVAELEARLGAPVAAATLFQHGTIRTLAQAIFDSDVITKWSHLVPIRPDGTEAPLILVHGIGGEVLSFRALVEHLDSRRPVYGLRARTDARPTSVEQVAADYILDLVHYLPHGPYCLAGYSGGGVIAFEIAQQLRAAGHGVQALIMIDAPLPSAIGDRRWSLRDPFRSIRAAAHWLTDDDFLKAGVGPAVARVTSRSRNWAARIQRGLASASTQPDIRDRLGAWRFPVSSRPFLEAMHGAIMSYRARRYEGRVGVIRARTGKFGHAAYQVPDLGWGTVVPGGVEVETVKAAHDTILTEPRVLECAAALSRVLERSARAAAAVATSSAPGAASRP